ncbi:MAG: Acylphosphatase-like protein [Methanomicrobiales archaeon 53_19]|uniref:acylphosphatase n=1 Tax=Methanocalculus sp. TaxID=2004547 RepID=UPI000748F08A|nr:acylphosphatase [Methanocalculus sp.]KUK70027.1 MAG: Acylphosphatase-like protein [Methanocalculus sp. 52_23]KUL02314.1 MAG: Acylphosphatase-like protein [Methanomicrobiales archaeon 53_19]HIJ05871.1 acylphosphatase [Methanocalculus sp.]
MKRFVAIADGRVQRVGYRDHVFDETFGTDISGYVKNLDTGEVEIVAEGQESDLLDLIKKINIIQRPIAVQSFRINWEEPTGAFSRFEIIRGDIQDETFERMDYAGKVLHSIDRKMDQSINLQTVALDKMDQSLKLHNMTLDKQDQMLDKQDRMLDKQDQMLEIGRETKEEIVGLRKDTGKYLEDEFREIKKKLSSIEDALVRAGIQV